MVWLAGMLTGFGLLGALVCVGLGAGAGVGVGTAAAAGGGGLEGVELVVECCANTEDAKNKLTATRLESRMTHLLSTAPVSAESLLCLDAAVDTEDISESCQ